MSTRITGRNLTLSFGATKALDGVDVDVQRGEILAILGPSGSGKSTLLHVLAGILRPDSGEVHFDERRIDNARESRRDLIRLNNFGFIFQFGDLIPELTLQENICLPMMLTGSGKQEAMRRASELSERLEISEVARRTVAEVSGGQAQRAAVARALIHRPAVIFADEPTGALDTVSGEIVMDCLVDLAREHGSSIVLVTHAVDIAAVSDREIVIRDGQIAQPVRA